MKLLTLARDLQRRRARERQGLFVAEGVRAAEELLRSPLVVRGALVSPSLGASPRGAALRAMLAERGIPLLEVSERDFESAAATESPQGVLLIGEVPSWRLEALTLPERPRLLVLDGVQDPGNVGTLLRTAAAFGVAATLAMPGTVDLWNGKVVRSAMGALFHRPALSCTWAALDEFLRDRAIPLWSADGAGERFDAVPPPAALALAVGNEGSGLSADALARTDRRVSIPTAPDVESLNVAVAAGILLYYLQS
ncbi:MAG: RNA methyltransferase [Gemmatimonadaceae bacterium]|nr:RNA methyltransferase [Gemmatimonadaceae bacterium]